MAAFVLSRKNVGFFGFSSADKIALFPSNLNESSLSSLQNPTVLSCKDSFPAKSDVQGNLNNGIVCASISNCGRYVAASDCNKKFYLWAKTENDTWTPSILHDVVRKAYKVVFTNSSTEVLLVDRTGDVYSYSVDDSSSSGKLIFGHICIILDVVMSKDDKYIITSDRDNKIRVSHYPNCYNIATYCFGHDEFVSSLCLVGTSEEFLVSGSGDSTLKLWNYIEGKLIYGTSISHHNFKTSSNEENSNAVSLKESCAVRTLSYSPVHNVMAALFHPEPLIGIYNVQNTEEPLVPVQLLHCKDIPLEARFDPQGNLWVYTLSETQSVVLYLYFDQGGILFKEADETIPEYSLVKQLNDKWQHKTLLTFEIDMKHLYKQYNDYDDFVNEDVKSKKKKKGK